jgi:VIT1/CCC1 family predicted Fe2+/Mn2+ transporter
MRLFGRVLEPVERLSEILFGLIMALTVTSAVSVATSDDMQIRTMLIAALGCNLAWGIIDAGMYLMARLGERGHNALVGRAVRKAPTREQAHRIIEDELPPVFASIFRPSRAHPGLTGRDWQGAIGVFALVVAATFPVVVPFAVIDDVRVALRISNVLAVASLFLCGFLFGQHAGLPPWLTGLVMVVVGVALVAIAIALGG